MGMRVTMTAIVVLVALVGCGANRVQTMTIEPTTLTLHGRDPVSPFTVTAYNAKGDVVPAPVVTWASSDTQVVKVDATGKVTPLSSGTATVSAAAGNAKVEVPVTVTIYTSIALADTAITLAPEESRTLSAQILNERQEPVEGTVTWESMDRAIAEVTPEGVVTGLAPGQTTLMARAVGVSSAPLPVTVVAPPPAPKGRASK